ncbi:MAG: leucine--tRNA ligase [Chitinophagales bacterium]|nr:leucine--tRNA ligase [Chitinophagales bacterium]
MKEIDFFEVEKRVKEIWKAQDVFRVNSDPSRPKYYVLDMFPYPSGAGLHVGHPLGYIASDIISRYKRLKGFNVLHPMGYDSFGLPAEQYAIQTGQHPAITTETNIKTFREQLDKLGLSYDWSREIRTSDPEFYKWTQWIFIQLFHSWYNNKTDRAEGIDVLINEFENSGNKNVHAACNEVNIFSADDWKGFSEKVKSVILLNYRLAYIADSWVNWCPALGTVLANDEVKDGGSERGGYPVIRKIMKQWSLRITAYAERLLSALEKLDWSDSIKETQKNWIGKSAGCTIAFQVEDSKVHGGTSNLKIEVFTTRPDTIFGVSYLALAPEHELIEKITTPEYKNAVDEYVNYAKNRSERDRMADVKKITGQFTGAYAVHPFTKRNIPVWIAEYVLAGYGTGALMAVPAHDQRDWNFAKHFEKDLMEQLRHSPIIEVISGGNVNKEAYEEFYSAGHLVNSEMFNGNSPVVAKVQVINFIVDEGIGKRKINYKMRDAIFGRQRYWGEPIPIYYDEEGIPYTVDEDDLPVILPEVDKYLPTETGEPPLARAKDWTYSPPSHLSLDEEDSRHARTQVLSLGEDLREVKNIERTSDENEVRKPGYMTADEQTWFRHKNNANELRREATPAEMILWGALRNKKLGVRFRRQHVIENFIVDFVSLEKKLVIELDGEVHKQQQDHDDYRTQRLMEYGYHVLRFWNAEVIDNTRKVIERIEQALRDPHPEMGIERTKQASQESPPQPFSKGEGNIPTHKEDLEGAYPLETTTMPGWAGSSWYYLRYEDPGYPDRFASKEAVDYWQNIDLYLGGDEHATGHLFYFRFWTKFLFDRGWIPFDEPAKKLVNQGKIQGVSKFIYEIKPIGTLNTVSVVVEKSNEIYISSSLYEKYRTQKIDPKTLLSIINSQFPGYVDIEDVLEDQHFLITPKRVNVKYVNGNELNTEAIKKETFEFGNSAFIKDDGKYLCGNAVEKMSKRYGNVVNPDDVLKDYGADCFRMYEMFLGPLEQNKPWDTKGIDGVSRFLKKFWKLFCDSNGNWTVNHDKATNEELKILHRTIKKTGEDIDRLSFNTSVSSFMICVNELTERNCHKQEILEPLLIILSPFAPFLTEYLWEKMDYKESIIQASFPQYDELLLVEKTFEYPVAINGKTRIRLILSLDLSSAEVEKEVLQISDLKKYFDGKSPKKIIYIKGKMINVVV